MDIKQKIILSDKLTKQLVNTSETGMGYHKVDIYLKNGNVIKNNMVLNCSVLTINSLIKINLDEIEKLIVF